MDYTTDLYQHHDPRPLVFSPYEIECLAYLDPEDLDELV